MTIEVEMNSNESLFTLHPSQLAIFPESLVVWLGYIGKYDQEVASNAYTQ